MTVTPPAPQLSFRPHHRIPVEPNKINTKPTPRPLPLRLPPRLPLPLMLLLMLLLEAHQPHRGTLAGLGKW